jgi:hypothetical protein
VAQLNVELPDRQLDGLRKYADWRRMPVAGLIQEYVDYLLSGGEPVTGTPDDGPAGRELAMLAERGGAFDWLAEEPDIYSAEDGEPV